MTYIHNGEEPEEITGVYCIETGDVTLNRLTTLIIAFVLAGHAPAILCADQEDQPVAGISLAELAAKAEFIGLAQIRDTDYYYRREYPVSGSAYLQVLIPYKADAPQDIIDVNEEGLHENECYFPNPTVLEEGRRYLLFLRRNPDDDEQYLRLEEGCALEVFVDTNNRYALKYPVSGINLSDDLQALAQPMDFADPYSRFSEEDIPPAERDALLDAGLIARDGETFRYTHGISLNLIRELMGPQGLTLDRSLKRVE